MYAEGVPQRPCLEYVVAPLQGAFRKPNPTRGVAPGYGEIAPLGRCFAQFLNKATHPLGGPSRVEFHVEVVLAYEGRARNTAGPGRNLRIVVKPDGRLRGFVRINSPLHEPDGWR